MSSQNVLLPEPDHAGMRSQPPELGGNPFRLFLAPSLWVPTDSALSLSPASELPRVGGDRGLSYANEMKDHRHTLGRANTLDA